MDYVYIYKHICMGYMHLTYDANQVSSDIQATCSDKWVDVYHQQSYGGTTPTILLEVIGYNGIEWDKPTIWHGFVPE